MRQSEADEGAPLPSIALPDGDAGDDSLRSCHHQMLASMAALETFPAVMSLITGSSLDLQKTNLMNCAVSTFSSSKISRERNVCCWES